MTPLQANCLVALYDLPANGQNCQAVARWLTFEDEPAPHVGSIKQELDKLALQRLVKLTRQPADRLGVRTPFYELTTDGRALVGAFRAILKRLPEES